MSCKGGWDGRIWMLLINGVPLLHLTAILFCLFSPWADWRYRVSGALLLLYIVPPLLTRIAFLIRGTPSGTIQSEGRGFLTWWFTFQLQILFCRFPFLEEILRLVPGLYSVWLRLWGSRIGRLTYWSAGVQVTDRSYLDIGDDVVFGAAVRLNAHVLTKDEKQAPQLIVDRVRVGRGTIVGGYSLLTAGTVIAENEVVRAFLVSPPYSEWKDGVRVRKMEPG